MSSETAAQKAHLLPLLRGAVAAVNAQRLDEAETMLDALLAQEPDFADALHLKGHVALQRGQVGLAAELVEAAIRKDFHFEDYHQTLGQIRLAQGNIAAARESFGTALVLNRHSLSAYLGLAHAALQDGDHDEALKVLRGAKRIDPEQPELRYLIGFVQMAKGDNKAASVNFRMALARVPDEQRYRAAYARALRGLTLKQPDADLIGSVLPLLGAPGVEPRDLASLVESALLLSPDIAVLRPVVDQPSASIAATMAGPAFPPLAENALLMAWLQHGLVMDTGLELLLTGLRRGALRLALAEPAALEPHAAWLAALAIRNFHAEYVDSETPEEREHIPLLEYRLSKIVALGQMRAGALAVLACYRPLYRTMLSEPLAGLSGSAWPAVLSQLRLRQLTEPLRERAIARDLPALTPVEDRTSKLVREMYEESPFPRWNQPVLGNALPLAQHLRGALPLQTIPDSQVPRPVVLVAGCGTGLHAILAATTYREAQVLAIDLSRASLAYAQRKAQQLNITNVRFAQADILKVGSLPERFDVIECFGVLHHLREPAAGLAQLNMLLRPGGYMMLGLYSEIGRRDVVEARRLIAAHGYTDSPDDIRRFRSDLENLAPELTARLRRSSAFHSLSDLRDLVFHRQEHRYFPNQLEALIRGAGLEFLGFEFTTPETLSHYRQTYPDDPRGISLANWAAVERAHPDLFANCYRFWLRKPAA